MRTVVGLPLRFGRILALMISLVAALLLSAEPLAEVVKRWPAFTTAKDRLAPL